MSDDSHYDISFSCFIADNFDEIKQEIFSIGYDLINHISTTTASEDDIKASMKTIMLGLQVRQRLDNNVADILKSCHLDRFARFTTEIPKHFHNRIFI